MTISAGDLGKSLRLPDRRKELTREVWTLTLNPLAGSIDPALPAIVQSVQPLPNIGDEAVGRHAHVLVISPEVRAQEPLLVQEAPCKPADEQRREEKAPP